MNKKRALKVFASYFNGKKERKDYTGRTIKRKPYNKRTSPNGWNIEHVLPKSRGGKNDFSNLLVTHIDNHDKKSKNQSLRLKTGDTVLKRFLMIIKLSIV